MRNEFILINICPHFHPHLGYGPDLKIWSTFALAPLVCDARGCVGDSSGFLGADFVTRWTSCWNRTEVLLVDVMLIHGEFNSCRPSACVRRCARTCVIRSGGLGSSVAGAHVLHIASTLDNLHFCNNVIIWNLNYVFLTSCKHTPSFWLPWE